MLCHVHFVRVGRLSSPQQMPDLDLFKPLAWEVVTLAESLNQARSAAENEARLRESGESMWTADRLAGQAGGTHVALCVAQHAQPRLWSR